MESVRKEENKKIVSFAASSLLIFAFNNVSSNVAQIIDYAIGSSYSDYCGDSLEAGFLF